MKKFIILIAALAVVLGFSVPVSAGGFRSRSVVVQRGGFFGGGFVNHGAFFQPSFVHSSFAVQTQFVAPQVVFPAVSYQLAVPFGPTVSVQQLGFQQVQVLQQQPVIVQQQFIPAFQTQVIRQRFIQRAVVPQVIGGAAASAVSGGGAAAASSSGGGAAAATSR